MIWLTGFPLPPSVNEYLMPVDGRLVKTPIHRQYRDLCHLWAAQNKVHFYPIKERLIKLRDEMEPSGRPFCLRVDMWMAFQYSRLFTLEDKCKELDRDNRVKPLSDGLAAVLEIDDRHIFAGNLEKVTTPRKEDECCILRLCLHQPRSLTAIQEMMKANSAASSS